MATTNMTGTQGMTSYFPNTSLLPSGSGNTAAVQNDDGGGTPAESEDSSSWSNVLSSIGSFGSSLLPSASTISGLAPYLAAAGIGVNQASKASGENKDLAGRLSALGQPLTQAGKSLLDQGMSGKLTVDQQATADMYQKQGQQLIDSAAPLAQIANTGFAQYQAGQLQPGQQQQIDQFVASAKQELRQKLGNSGIADSSILASQDAAIDAQAVQLKANLMQQNLGIADQQFSQWLTTTQAGQKVQQEGKQFAANSINTMLQQALGFTQAGMGAEEQAVQLAISSNSQLSSSVSQLFQSIMMAYATQQYQKGAAGGGAGAGTGGAGAGGGNPLSKLFGGGGSGGLGGEYASGGMQDARLYGGYGNDISSQYNWGSGLTFDAGFNDGTSGYNLNPDGTVDTSTFQDFFYDPSADQLPEINFGGSEDTAWDF